jgi:hypothetical protein
MRRRGGITEWGSRTSHAESDPYLYPHHQTIDRLLSFHQSIEKFQTRRRRRRRKGTQKIRFVVVFFFFFSKMRWILLQSFVCVCVCVCNGHNGGAALCVCARVHCTGVHHGASSGVFFFFSFYLYGHIRSIRSWCGQRRVTPKSCYHSKKKKKKKEEEEVISFLSPPPHTSKKNRNEKENCHQSWSSFFSIFVMMFGRGR